MVARISPFIAEGTVDAPPSKSVAQRYLILAALSKGKTVVENCGNSDDVAVVIKNLARLGAKIETDGNNATVYGVEIPPKKAELDFGESGFAMRSLIPVAAALGTECTFITSGRLSLRPLSSLFVAFKGGVKATDGGFSGKLESGDYEIECGESSQFLSGLIIALAAVKGKSTVKLKGEKVSFGYVLTTIAALEKFGVRTIVGCDEITVFGGEIKSPRKVITEGDFSAAANLLALGALGKSVTVNGLDVNSKQPDRAIIDILKDYGANVEAKENSITVRGGERRAITFSCENAPDLALIVAALAAYADGESVIKRADRLTTKESDRAEAIIKTLTCSGIKTERRGDEIFVFGGKPRGGVYAAIPDHRVVMAQSVLASSAEGQSEISCAECVNKSFPEFFGALKLAGGNDYVNIQR